VRTSSQNWLTSRPNTVEGLSRRKRQSGRAWNAGAKEPLVQLSMLKMSKTSWGAAMLLTIGLIVGLLVWGIDPDPDNFLAAASQGESTIAVDGVSCLWIKQVMYDAKDYSDPKLPEAIVDILSIKTILPDADYAACRWGFDIAVVPKTEPHVRYNGQPARYLVSIAICDRTVDGRMNPNKCLSKNVYVFTPRVAPHDLFLIALDGLARRQTSEWESFQRRKSK
jgi:hypothetical protein